jgi:hypothetical protein
MDIGRIRVVAPLRAGVGKQAFPGLQAFLLFFLPILLGTSGCAGASWTLSTQSAATKYFFDARSAEQVGPSAWVVKERFLDINTDRWALETEARYDCEARTFLTLAIRRFSEHRPVSRAAEIRGNQPVEVVPGSLEEARLEAICAAIGG